MKCWKEIPLLTEADPILGKYEHGEFQTLIEKGQRGSWDDFGVRDPALLTTATGDTFLINESHVLFYTGSTRSGMRQATGRANFMPGEGNWAKVAENPVIQAEDNGWDCGLATTAWVLQDEGKFKLYYRGAKGVYKEEGIGLAISVDGTMFTRHPANPVLKPDIFPDLSLNPLLMGALHILKNPNRKYVLTFEGHSISNQNGLAIYGAISDDGVCFEPLNNGFPIFSPHNVRNWPLKRVANPRIIFLEQNQLYVLCYNGHFDSGYYGLGLAFSSDLNTWIDYKHNPLVLPTSTPVGMPFSGRIEGGVPVKEQISSGQTVALYFMAIPRRGPSHKNGVVGRIELNKISDPLVQNFYLNKHESDQFGLYPPEAPTELRLVRSYNSLYPPQVQFILSNSVNKIEAVKLAFLVNSHSAHSLLFLGYQVPFVDSIDVICIELLKGKVLLYRPVDKIILKKAFKMLYVRSPKLFVHLKRLLLLKTSFRIPVSSWVELKIFIEKGTTIVSFEGFNKTFVFRKLSENILSCFGIFNFNGEIRIKDVKAR